MNKTCVILCLSTLLSTGVELSAQNVYRVNSQAQWRQWQFPKGAIELTSDGSIKPVKFEQFTNVALDAGEFVHQLKQGDVRGGVWQVGSGTATASRIIDGSMETFWRPDQNASVDEWWLEIDLGRAVAVKEIRLHFPDREGARPLRQFRVFGSSGKFQSILADVFSFDLIGGTTKWNEETLISYPVAFGEATKLVLRLSDASISGAADISASAEREGGSPDQIDGTTTVGSQDQDSSTAFAMLQYIRIVVDVKSEDAALAEVEVISFGENIAAGTQERGGIIDDRGKGRTAGLNDLNVNTFWEELISGGTEGEASQLNWDLGAVYWINRVIFVAFQETTTWYRPRVLSHRLLGSDGSRTPSGKVDFDILFDFPDPRDWTNPEPLTYLLSPYKRIRNLFMLFEGSSTGSIAEAIIIPTGHVARVELTSDFIKVSDRPKVMQTLEWEADVPPGTKILAQTRSGNTVIKRMIYYKKNLRGGGVKEVDKEEYDKRASLQAGTEERVELPDWSGWSNVYQVSGQGFLSPSPRSFVQFRVVLDSDRPEAAPTLHSLTLNFADALLAGAVGEVSPREAEPGTPRLFTYILQPEFGPGDRGFNRILLETPSQVDADSLAIRIDGTRIDPTALKISPDSLIIGLPGVVRRHQVELDVHVNVMENPYLFNAFVGHTSEPALWQQVDPAGRDATTVLLLSIPNSKNLLGNVSIQPRIVTPNGDGVGEQAEIRFSVLKTETPPAVRIYSLGGTLVEELEGGRGQDGFWVYNWAGTEKTGDRVAPGIYLCRIELAAQADTQTLTRTISVAY